MKLKVKPTKKAYSVAIAAAIATQSVFTAPIFADDGRISGDTELSSLGIDINLDFPTFSDTFYAELHSKDGDLEPQKFEINSNDEGNAASGVIKNIPVGKYTLKITADGYPDYTQEVTIKKGFTTRVELNNSKRKNEFQNNPGNEKHGVIAIGDVNDDGVIDDKDSEIMMKAIESGSAEAKYDLNNDGVVNIADLTYVTLNYGGNVTATPLDIIPSENINAEMSSDTVIKYGTLSDLTEDIEKYVRFSAANEEAISPENPVEFSLDINNPSQAMEQTVKGIVIKPPKGSENLIETGIVTIEAEDGRIYSFNIGGEETLGLADVNMTRDAVRSPEDKVTIESDGTVVINIGTQIAIKKIIIKVTGASTNLVDIAKVEFVNNMEDRIPEPELNIPENIILKQMSAGENPSFSVTWEPQVNITGYEVQISSNGNQVIQATNNTTITVTGLGSGKLATYEPYTVRVRSTNGNWKSLYSESAVITLKPDSAPPAPEYVSAQGQVESVKVTWRKMRDTQNYTLFYREKGTEKYSEINNITSTSYVISNLKPNVTYEVYVIGYNELGASPASQLNQATTIAAVDVEMPKYKLINTSNGAGKVTAHVINEENPTGAVLNGDTFAVTDNNQATYTLVNDWDTGVVYSNHSNPIITLDKKYTIDTIRFAPSASQQYGYSGVKIRYRDENGAWSKADNCSISQKKDKNGNIYYTATASEPITSDTFQLCITTGYNRMITISEMKFYYYDDLVSQINGLYEDSMHLQLKSDVTQATVDELKRRLDVPDSVSGELHPDYDSLKKELEYAEELLNTGALADVISVDTKITPSADRHTDFAMSLSNYQPLGTVARAGDEIIIYVGSPNEKDGAKTNLSLIATQNHGEAAKWQSDMGQLKVGRNVITVPAIATSAVSENGGSLYVAWNGNSGEHEYSIRVSGGESIPVLNVAGKTGSERTEEIQAYIGKLEKHVSELRQKHDENHEEKEYRNDCILNYTEIVMDNMMYSVPAAQVLAGLGGGGAQKLETAISAMEQQVDLFYQHKGYSKTVDSASKNKYPSQRLNIRYHTMFTGAFMYAGGKHIGIEYGSVPGLFSISPITADDKGKKISGQLSGWGIAHEIGHVINSGSYAVAEVTNNYFSMLATQTQRTNYQNVYKDVTKGSIGHSSSVFTTLGMYWQLHMFYDNYYDYKMFDDNGEQLKNLFYARLDSYVRNPASAPNKGTPLTLSGGNSDKFIRLACASAEKNLLSFFDAWGLSYNDDTKKYAEQFEIEEHKIQYFNNDAREYRLNGGAAMSSATKVIADITTPHENNVINDNKVVLSLDNNSADKDSMLGYEIIRNGEPVAFILANETSYTDIITTGNNMVYEYQVIGYDKLLNETEATVLESVKIKHEGNIDRDGWTIETNMTSDADEKITADGESGYCEDTYISAISNIIGKGSENGYSGKTENGNAEIIVDFGGVEKITALKYNGASAGFTVYVSEDKENWTEVKKGSFTGGKDETVYFDQPDSEAEGYMYIYKAAYVKVVFDKSEISINDFNILGPTSDNVELLDSGIGTLKNDFIYDKNTKASIPAGSLVFTGVYKGNPAYNAVKLLDENGNIINGSQIVMAEDPKDGQLGNVSEGIWIYWIEPQDISDNIPKNVRAELYRVDNAITLENERLVSNTLVVDVPASLPEIVIDSESVYLQSAENDDINDKKVEEEDNGEVSTNTEDISDIVTTESDIEDFSDNSDANEEIDKDNIESDSGISEITPEGTTDSNVEVEKINIEAKAIMALSKVTSDGYTVRMDENSLNNSGFIFTKYPSDGKKALMKLNLTDDSTMNTIAFQTSFSVSDPKVSDVNMIWSEVVDNRAILKECRYDSKKGTVFIYVVAKEDLFDNGTVTLGDIQMNAESGVKESRLKLNPNSTVTLSDDFSTKTHINIGGDVTLTFVSENNNGGSSGGGSPRKNKTNNSDAVDKSKNTIDNSDVSDENSNNVSNGDDVLTTGGSTDVSDVFSDISKTAWYYTAVQQAYNNEWFMGTSANKFSPDANMTRGMFVTVLGRFANATGTPSDRFNDVSSASYYAGFVAWAAENGIVSGVSNDKFSPESDVTREQLAVMVYNYMKFIKTDLEFINNKVDFTDDDKISVWAKEAVYYMQRAGIISGMPDGSFKPKGTATRAEVATIFMNLSNKLSNVTK